MKKSFIAILLLSSLPAFAVAKIPVSWECVLSQNDAVECRDIEDTFKQSNPGFQIASKDQSKLHVRVGSNQLNEFTEYVIRLTIKGQDEKQYKKKISDVLSSFEKTEKVSGFLQVTTNAAKEELEYQEEPKKDKPYYLQPSMEIEGGKQPGSNFIVVVGEVGGNYSKPEFRVAGDTWVVMKRQVKEENAFTQKIESNEVKWGAYGGGAYSIVPNVSIGVWGGYMQTKTDIVTEESLGIPAHALQNTATKVGAKIGVEWIQHPIINDKTNGNFSVRGYVQGEHHNYLDPQTFDIRKETFARPTLEGSYNHQFRSFNLGGTVSGYRSVGREGKELQGVQFGGKANFNIKDTVVIEPNFTLDYTENRVRTTAGTNYSFMDLTGMQDNDNLTFKYGITLKVPLGNARLSRQERRWKDVK